AKELKSATSVLKLIGLKNRHQLSRDVIANTFSGNLRTLYVHFALNVNAQHLQQLCETFNKKQLESNSDEKSENKSKKAKRQPKCQIYLRNYVDEIKKRKQQEAFNPELNKIVLLKNIKETLEEYGYSVEQVKRFNRMPMVMVTLSKSEDTRTLRLDMQWHKSSYLTKTNQDPSIISSNVETVSNWITLLKNVQAKEKLATCIDVYYARKIIQVIRMQEKNLESN
ncbi:hypothetical protein RFI_26504, partial [Reticulomyxa filosa]